MIHNALREILMFKNEKFNPIHQRGDMCVYSLYLLVCHFMYWYIIEGFIY